MYNLELFGDLSESTSEGVAAVFDFVWLHTTI